MRQTCKYLTKWSIKKKKSPKSPIFYLSTKITSQKGSPSMKTFRFLKSQGIFTSKIKLFFLINNGRILLIIEKLPSRVHWRCTMGAKIRKQKNNSQEKKKRKNKKNGKRPHSIQRECVRRT